MRNNEDVFRNHFSAIAAGPGGVARLREMLLELAFRGKLVPQLESEQSGTPSKTAITGPFALPSGWRWTTLRNCTKTWKQKIPDRPFTYIDVASIDNVRGRVGTDLKIIEPTDAPSRARKIVKEGTVIFSTVRPYLKNVAIIEREYQPEPIVSTAFSVLHPLENINARFLFHYLRSSPLMEYVSAEMTGMAYPAITDRKLLEAPIPVPPLAEQHRIVEKVDRLMALCDDLESRQQAERESRRRLRMASLAALEEAAAAEAAERAWAHVAGEFGRLVDTVEDVIAIRQTILRLAVWGSLSQKWRREKPNKFLEGWRAVTLDDVATCRLGKMLDRIKNQGTLTPYLRNVNVRWFDFDLSDIKEIRVTENERNEFSLQNGDVLICEGGEPGRCAIWKGSEIEYIFQKAIHRVRVGDNLLPEWLCFCLKDAADSGRLSDQFTGSTIKHFTGVSLKQFRFLLPPIREQHHIIEMINALMAFCDGLEAGIRARDAALEAFAVAACRAVLGWPATAATPAAVAGKITGQQRLPV